MSDLSDITAREDFNKARSQARMRQFLGAVRPQHSEMLSFQEVKDVVRPRSESYRGLRTVPIRLIVGSEGRYNDFTREFLPRREHLRSRWTRVDKAHLTNITLPPIKLYEIGGVYFVRDGNHRVSVARLQGVQDIDAEVVSLESELTLDTELTRDSLLQQVLNYEKDRFYRETRLPEILGDAQIEFSAPGRYDEILRHVEGHRFFLGKEEERDISDAESLRSWYENVYLPIAQAIRDNGMLQHFPGRTESDLYVWLVRHWHYLKQRYGEEYSIGAAADDFALQFGYTVRDRLRAFWRWITGRAALNRREALGDPTERPGHDRGPETED